ncbi:hypothetical protein M0811_05014 [Anaeramoeba ignava]|uniref:BTB domain-containing protein n=1 Tax=Anaeramoeba ignava TaxID=1746090 RepID=A0A9Q0LT45_ANAIG|nr:hypothetical protein M0811_05014 [Anaeramoeba ignava]
MNQNQNQIQFQIKKFNKFLINQANKQIGLMFGNEETSDFQIYCGKDKILIPCHKSILEARSKYFMINRKENKFNSIYFNNFSSEIVKPIIKFFYNGKFKFDKQKFDEYFKFANEIKLKEIKIKIELEIQSIFNIQNILEIYFKSQKINSKNLSQNCEKFIFQNIQFIISNPNFDKYLNQNQNQIYNFIGLISLNQNISNKLQIIQQIKQKLNQNNQKEKEKENIEIEIENSFSNLLNQISQTKSINQFQIQQIKNTSISQIQNNIVFLNSNIEEFEQENKKTKSQIYQLDNKQSKIQETNFEKQKEKEELEKIKNQIQEIQEEYQKWKKEIQEKFQQLIQNDEKMKKDLQEFNKIITNLKELFEQNRKQYLENFQKKIQEIQNQFKKRKNINFGRN